MKYYVNNPAEAIVVIIPPLLCWNEIFSANIPFYQYCFEAFGDMDSRVIVSVGKRTDPDSIARYRDLGVSRMIIPPPAFDPEGLRKGLHEFADNVIAKL